MDRELVQFQQRHLVKRQMERFFFSSSGTFYHLRTSFHSGFDSQADGGYKYPRLCLHDRGLFRY